MCLAKSEVERYLTVIQAIGAEHRLTDMHVHPFEVVFGAGRYAANSHATGVWSTADLCYVPPCAGEMDLASQAAEESDIPAPMRERLALLGLRRLYVHTGKRCFGDQMLMGGISRALLLPVTRPASKVDEEMAMLVRIFGDDPRFLFGFSVPGETADRDIEAILRRAVELWGVRAVKMHPALSGLDLSTPTGRSRGEAILAAAGQTRLPVIIHGGAYPNIIKSCGLGFGLLQNMECLDFSLTRHPVVIAHAGAFGLNRQQVETDVLPRLERLLQRYVHLCVDISALSAEVIGLIVPRVEPQRILFGSDALYDLPWKSLVRLFVALEKVAGHQAEALLIQIAGINSDHMLGKEARGYGKTATHQIFPVH